MRKNLIPKQAPKVDNGFDIGSFDMLEDARLKDWVQDSRKKQSLKDKLLLSTVATKSKSYNIRAEAIRTKELGP